MTLTSKLPTLFKELEAFQAANDLPFQSADEQLIELYDQLSDEQKAFLTDFSRRWDESVLEDEIAYREHRACKPNCVIAYH